jgi:hypothetical protein
MTTLIGLDADSRELRLPSGAPYRLRLRIRAADGGYALLADRALSMTIYAGSTLIASSAGAIDSDDTSNFALFAFSAIDRAAAGTKSSGSWEIAELFTGTPNPEKMPLVGGPVYFSEAAPLGAGSPSDPASAFDSYEWSAAGALTLDSSAAPALSESQAEALIAPIEARADEKIAETEAVRAAAQQVVDDWEAVLPSAADIHADAGIVTTALKKIPVQQPALSAIVSIAGNSRPVAKSRKWTSASRTSTSVRRSLSPAVLR